MVGENTEHACVVLDVSGVAIDFSIDTGVTNVLVPRLPSIYIESSSTC